MKMRLLAAGLGLVLSSSVFAASDGTIGATSTGSSDISVTLPKLIIATGFADYAFGSYAGTGDLNGDDDIIVSVNFGSGAQTYKVNPSGSGTAGAFTLTDGTQTIAYNAYFNDATGLVGQAALANGVDLTAQGGANNTLGSAVESANLDINIPEANLQAVSAGAYSGTLTLVFTPE